MPNYNSPRYQRWYTQLQTTFPAINNTSGVWTNTGNKLIRVDANSVNRGRNAPYSRFPVLTGNRSEVVGIRGRKSATFSIRGLPVVPPGTAGGIPDIDHILQNAFGQPATVVASTSATYSLLGTGYLPFTLLGFAHGFSSLTSEVFWGCVVTRITLNFNGLFLTMDVDGMAGFMTDNIGFTAQDLQGNGQLTTFPVEPSSPTVNGQPIAGFGQGYTTTLSTQSIALKVRTRSITWETGLEIVGDVEGSPYGIAVVGGTRRLSLALTALDDDSAALNAIKVQCDTDNGAAIALVSVSGTVAGSIVTVNLNNIQANSFSMRDNGNLVDFELPQSFAHASAVGQEDDTTMVFT